MSETAVTDRGPPAQDEDDSYSTPEDTSNLESFLSGVVKRFNRVESYESQNRREAVDDIRFRKGDQWPEAIKSARTIDKRPCLTINKLPTFIHQIVNDQRQNRPSINVSPVGDGSDPEVAKMLKGLIKYIERCSNADVAYDTGFESAVTIGWGFWRILTDYESEDSFDQTIKIKRITNPMTVYLDYDAKEPDGSDAQWAFITEMIPREQYKAQYPDFPVEAWQEDGVGDEYKNWSTQSHVRIAEYFYYEKKTRYLLALSNGHIGFEDELDDSILDEIDANPDMVISEREVESKRIKWCKLTAYDILEENDWPGKYIPIVRVIGDEVDLEGRIDYIGIVRAAKDPQRMYNFWCTSETELIALAPKAPWVMEEGQIEGHEQRWAQANVKSLPFLLYKGTNVAGKPAPPPQRQQFAGPPTGVVQAKISAAQDMQAVTGIRFDATQQERMYDESGKALRELKRVGDLGNFHYVDNLSRSLRWTGRILIDLIPKVYDTRRVLTILREDDSQQKVTLDPNLTKPYEKREEENEVQLLYNPKLGQYDVTVTVGPSFATKRAEAADSMLLFMKAVPQAGPIIGDLIAKNMDWPGAEEIATRLASMLPPGLQDEKLENLPPEAKAMVLSLQQQTQQLKAEHDKAIAMLGDKEADREVQRQKIEADYSSKMQDMQTKFMEKLMELKVDLMTHNQSPDTSALDYQVQMSKIGADQEAKMTKIAADQEARYMELIANLREQITTQRHEIDMFKREEQMEKQMMKEQKGMRRQDDLQKFEKLHDTLNTQIKSLEDRMKMMEKMEVVFDRDPKTNRISKARRVLQ